MHKEFVFVTHDHESDSALFALNRKTGKTLWKVDRIGSKPSSSTPTIYETNNGKTYVVSSSQSHGCYAVDIETGKILWETGQGTLDKRSVSSPYFSGGHFFASCGSGGRGSRFLIIHPSKSKRQSFYQIYHNQKCPICTHQFGHRQFCFRIDRCWHCECD